MSVLGVQIQFIVLPLVVAALWVTFVALHRLALRDLRGPRKWTFQENTYSDSGWSIGAFIAALFAGCAFVTLLILLIPFNPTYWVFWEKTGVIESVSNEFKEGSGRVTYSSYLVTFEDGTSVVLRDPRVLDAAGSKVSLSCTVEWVYLSSDRLNCNVREVTR